MARQVLETLLRGALLQRWQLKLWEDHVDKVSLIFTFVTTKYSTPSQVVPLVMPFSKLYFELL